MSSNQTVAGLKHSYRSLTNLLMKFKSDRCGIETIVSGTALKTPMAFKSDRCGIETYSREEPRQSHIQFKSDRCGIETEGTLFEELDILKVQIRPLRD